MKQQSWIQKFSLDAEALDAGTHELVRRLDFFLVRPRDFSVDVGNLRPEVVQAPILRDR